MHFKLPWLPWPNWMIEAWQSPGGLTPRRYAASEVREALTWRLTGGNLERRLEESLVPNATLTIYVAAHRPGHAARAHTPAVDEKNARQRTQRTALITSVLGRMTNEHLCYIIQYMIGTIMLFRNTARTVWDMFRMLKIVPAQETVEQVIDQIADNALAEPVPQRDVLVSCFDNYDKYVKSYHERNLMMHWVVWYFFCPRQEETLSGAIQPPNPHLQPPAHTSEYRTSTRTSTTSSSF